MSVIAGELNWFLIKVCEKAFEDPVQVVNHLFLNARRVIEDFSGAVIEAISRLNQAETQYCPLNAWLAC